MIKEGYLPGNSVISKQEQNSSMIRIPVFSKDIFKILFII